MVDSQQHLSGDTEAEREKTQYTTNPDESFSSVDTPIPDSGADLRRKIEADDENDIDGQWVKTYEGVPIFCEYKEHIFRSLLRDYESYMLNYESTARRSKWRKHYENIQQTIDQVVGLRSGENTTELSEEELNTLEKVGCFALFGCGFNVTRELSPKLKLALKDEKIKIVLIDFSKKALKSSIELLVEEGITPVAAYQMDLTMGAASSLNTYRKELRAFRFNDSLGTIVEYRTYLEKIDRKLDSMIKQFDSEKKFPDMFDDYQMSEDHRPTAVVSTMVTTATFVTIFEELVKQFAPYPELMEDLHRLHAKYNAFIIRMNASKLANLCKGNGKVCMIMDVNKISIDVDPQVRDATMRGKIVRSIREAVDATLESSEDCNDREIENLRSRAREELRISKNGEKTESLELLLKDESESKNQTAKTIEKIKVLKRWHWWDEDGYGQEHGHRVEAVEFTVNNMKNEIRGLLDQLPDDIKQSGNPVMAAKEFKKLLDEAVSKESQAHNSTYGRIMDFLKEVNVPEISSSELPEETLNSRRPYVFIAGYELIDLAHIKIWESKWEKVLEYLTKERKWLDDGYTQEHVKTGLHWLGKFLETLKKLS